MLLLSCGKERVIVDSLLKCVSAIVFEQWATYCSPSHVRQLRLDDACSLQPPMSREHSDDTHLNETAHSGENLDLSKQASCRFRVSPSTVH